MAVTRDPRDPFTFVDPFDPLTHCLLCVRRDFQWETYLLSSNDPVLVCSHVQPSLVTDCRWWWMLVIVHAAWSSLLGNGHARHQRWFSSVQCDMSRSQRPFKLSHKRMLLILHSRMTVQRFWARHVRLLQFLQSIALFPDQKAICTAHLLLPICISECWECSTISRSQCPGLTDWPDTRTIQYGTIEEFSRGLKSWVCSA